MRISFFILLTLISFQCFSQTIDVQHYRFQIQLSDENDKISGKATVVISFLQSTKNFSLDFIGAKGNGKGMKVEELKGKNVNSFQQSKDKLHIELKNPVAAKVTDSFEIFYSGIPADGLVISKKTNLATGPFFLTTGPTGLIIGFPVMIDPMIKPLWNF